MRSYDELEALWTNADPMPRDGGTVDLICARKGDGVHEVIETGTLTTEDGLVGDRWASGKRDMGYQITLMMTRVAEWICDGEQPLHMPGDNFLVNFDLSEQHVPAGTRIRLGSALVEVTAEPHTGCKKFNERFGAEALRWINWKPERHRHLRGINCRVIEAGEVRVGDSVQLA